MMIALKMLTPLQFYSPLPTEGALVQCRAEPQYPALVCNSQAKYNFKCLSQLNPDLELHVQCTVFAF